MEKIFEKFYSQNVRLPEELAGKIEVRSCIGYSDAQQVYLVEDSRKRPFVLKVAAGEKKELLRKDAAVLQEHRYSFLPGYAGYTETEETGYLLREYIAGDTIWEWVNRRGPFPREEADALLCRLCDMVGQFHRQTPPVIHRDVKPQNIVITEEKNLFLIDMGTVREYKADLGQDTIFIGTKPTAAPEQYGYRQTDCRTDIYALGVLYLFLLTGSLDVQSPKNWEALDDPEVCSVIRRCTKMDPDDRYQSCEELQRAVRKLRETRRTESAQRRRRTLWETAALALGGIFFCTGIHTGHAKSLPGKAAIAAECGRRGRGKSQRARPQKAEQPNSGGI